MRPALVLLLLTISASVRAQLPKPRALPQEGKAPLLHVLFSGPRGVSVTFYQGLAAARRFETPVVVGLRPGYVYRMKVTGFPERPGLEFHPTIEVRGTLRLPPDLPGSRHPCPIRLSEFDVERVLDGSLITKVFYLENPKNAVPEAGNREIPVESEIPAERDLLTEARQYGRPMLVYRLGNRDVSEEELRQDSVANTIMFPGETDMGFPRKPPILEAFTFQWFDPLAGARPPEEECVRDGGDAGVPAGFGRDGRLQGLDPEDTIAEYRDSQGNKKFTVSNRVCLCVPRFAALRSVLRLDLNRMVLGPGAMRRLEGQQQLDSRRGPMAHQQTDHAADLIGREAPGEMNTLIGTLVTGRIESTKQVEARLGTLSLTGVCNETPRATDKPLFLQKWCDRCDGEIGDEATFTLKYVNQGGRPITDVAVSDSLTGRLEYVPGSAQSSRNAVFTTAPNEAGSLVLRWQINGTLQPGESGVVRFKVKVR